jgi:hypothetical protein
VLYNTLRSMQGGREYCCLRFVNERWEVRSILGMIEEGALLNLFKNRDTAILGHCDPVIFATTFLYRIQLYLRLSFQINNRTGCNTPMIAQKIADWPIRKIGKHRPELLPPPFSFILPRYFLFDIQVTYQILQLYDLLLIFPKDRQFLP